MGRDERMTEHEQRSQDDVEAVTERNVTGMRELLAEKHRQQQLRGAEPPLADDPHVGSHEDRAAQDPSGSPGNASGIRNLGGGRP